MEAAPPQIVSWEVLKHVAEAERRDIFVLDALVCGAWVAAIADDYGNEKYLCFNVPSGITWPGRALVKASVMSHDEWVRLLFQQGWADWDDSLDPRELRLLRPEQAMV